MNIVSGNVMQWFKKKISVGIKSDSKNYFLMIMFPFVAHIFSGLKEL